MKNAILGGKNQRHALSSDLIVFPVPDVKCRLLEGLDRLLRQGVLDEGNQQSADTRGIHTILSKGVPANVPLGNWGHPVLG